MGKESTADLSKENQNLTSQAMSQEMMIPPKEQYVKFSNSLNDQYNDLNFWRPRIPFIEEIDEIIDQELNPDKQSSL